MRIVGIDFGSKRIGIAVSDEGAKLAFPKAVLPNTPSAAEEIEKIANTNGAKRVVVGESKDFSGRENSIMPDVRVLVRQLETKGFEVFLEPEYFSSEEAVRFQGMGALTDASAAAVILQRFLDRN